MLAANFKSTRWTSVLRAGKPDAPGAHAALAALCEDYWPPLYQFARTWTKTPEDAEDLTQSFFGHFIERNLPAVAGPERGHFRTFLLACFKNFIRDEWKHAHRAGAIPKELITSIRSPEDTNYDPGHDPAATPSFDSQLDWFWAESIRQRVTCRLEEGYRSRQKAAVFDHLRCLLVGEKPAKSYEELGVELGLSEAGIKMEVLRLRARFRERFRAEVAQTVADAGEVEAESRYLLSVLFSEGTK
jgi:RNA polymerase sigma-70 factor (ECF subfamily)